MRETPNIKLTQFEPNDVPNWLDQYNSDMVKVDTAIGAQGTENSKYELRFTADEELINNNRTQINENTQDIANVKDDIKNIKGGSTTSIASLQTEVTEVSQSLTTLKGCSDRTIAELENDLNTDKAEISAIDGRVETLEDTTAQLENDVTTLKNNAVDISTLEKKVGTDSTANFGSDLSKAIGNTDIHVSHTALSISNVLNMMINGTKTIELEQGDIGSIGGTAHITHVKNSSLCAPALLTIALNGVSGTLNTGTHTIFTAPLTTFPGLAKRSYIFLTSASNLFATETTSTADRVDLYLRTTTTTIDIIIVVSNGQFIFRAPSTENIIIPIVLPLNAFY